MITLTDVQHKIASFDKGALLVKASAGSGKTLVLTARIARLIAQTKRQILAITFTNKACEEIKNRLQNVEDLDDKVFVGTFHSFCSSILEKHCSVLGYAEPPQLFPSELDYLKLIEDVLTSIPALNEKYEEKTSKERELLKKRILQEISSIKRDVILDEDLQSCGIDELTIEVYRNYRDLMKSQNVIDYDDLLYLTYILFSSNPRIASLYRKNYEYICIDEAQDLNQAQYMLLRALTGDENNNVMLVGDPNQSIYGFNGSSSIFMEKKFVEDYNPYIIVLKENYRSCKKVLEYANKLMPNSSNIQVYSLEGVCEINSFLTPQEEAKAVVSKIKDLLNAKELPDIDGRLTPDQISIIARNKYVLFDVESCLKDAQIPYFYKNTIKGLTLSSTYGKIFDLALQIRINPKDTLHLKELSRMVGIENATSLKELHSSVFDEDYLLLLGKAQEMRDDGSNFRKIIHEIQNHLNEAGKSSNESELNDELNVALSDFSQIEKCWVKYEINNTLMSLSQFRNYLALGKIVSVTEKNGVALSTVHTMKGQESNVVFLIGMDDMTFPDYRAVQKGANSTEMQQEKNDLYVAITRARRYLFISYPLHRTTLWGNTYPRRKSSILPE